MGTFSFDYSEFLRGTLKAGDKVTVDVHEGEIWLAQG